MLANTKSTYLDKRNKLFICGKRNIAKSKRKVYQYSLHAKYFKCMQSIYKITLVNLEFSTTSNVNLEKQALVILKINPLSHTLLQKTLKIFLNSK